MFLFILYNFFSGFLLASMLLANNQLVPVSFKSFCAIKYHE